MVSFEEWLGVLEWWLDRKHIQEQGALAEGALDAVVSLEMRWGMGATPSVLVRRLDGNISVTCCGSQQWIVEAGAVFVALQLYEFC